MFETLKNLVVKTFGSDKYKPNDDAVVISCYFNSENNPYRLEAFKKWYASIKHLNYSIIECIVGDAEPELPSDPNIKIVRTKDLFWHKEALLNKIVSDLPAKYKYVFWIDADVIFTNQNWLNEAVEQLQTNSIVQLFEYCVHLEEGQIEPNFDMERATKFAYDIKQRNSNIWRSFGSNYGQGLTLAKSDNYDEHGHVGFAWGARRAVLDLCPLYDKALVGGADHIIAHAAVGQIPCACITNSFTADIDAINAWSKEFYEITKGRLSYVKGNVYHLWHGDVNKREYLKRIKEFTPVSRSITEKNEHGLYTTNDQNAKQYVKEYMTRREDTKTSVKPATKQTSKQQPKQQSKKSAHIGTYGSSGSRITGGYSSNNSPQYDEFGNLIQSAVLGYLTDSAVVGGMGGGSLIGGLIGQELRDSGDNNNNNTNDIQYGGGDAGGNFS